MTADTFCAACFTGEYPCEVPAELRCSKFRYEETPAPRSMVGPRVEGRPGARPEGAVEPEVLQRRRPAPPPRAVDTWLPPRAVATYTDSRVSAETTSEVLVTNAAPAATNSSTSRSASPPARSRWAMGGSSTTTTGLPERWASRAKCSGSRLPGPKKMGATTTSLGRLDLGGELSHGVGREGLEGRGGDHLEFVTLSGGVVGVEHAHDAHGGGEAAEDQFLDEFRGRSTAGDDVHAARSSPARRSPVGSVHRGVT